MMIGTTSRVVKVEYIHDGTTSGRYGLYPSPEVSHSIDVHIEDYGRRWIKTNYTKETSLTSVPVGYNQSDGNIYMFDQTLNGAQTVHILICESHPLSGMFRCLLYDYQDLTIQTLSSVMVTSSCTHHF